VICNVASVVQLSVYEAAKGRKVIHDLYVNELVVVGVEVLKVHNFYGLDLWLEPLNTFMELSIQILFTILA
jgi:hypothetical protein